jgi:tetratricopeptide (TPR) repeat protein
MAAYKMLTMKDPAAEPFSLELADIYMKMGLREEALAQYKMLFQHYKSLGRKDKALKVMALMAQMHPRKAELKKEITGLEHLMKLKDGEVGIATQRKAVIPEESFGEKRREAYFDLGAELEMAEPEGTGGHKEIEISKKINGLKEIIKKLKEDSGPDLGDPNWNYNLGVACRQLGFFDDAIEHLRVSYEKRQKPFDAAYLLGLCFKEKVMWEEALQAFEKALSVDGISQGNILAVRYEMGLIFKEQGKTEEALELLRKILGSRSGISGFNK